MLSYHILFGAFDLRKFKFHAMHINQVCTLNSNQFEITYNERVIKNIPVPIRTETYNQYI